MTDYRTSRAIVLTSEGVFYDTGTTQSRPIGVSLTDLPVVLGGALRTIGAGSEGVLMIATDVESLAEHLPRLRPDGWQYTALRPWTSFRHLETRTTIHVGALADPGLKGEPLFNPADAPATIAARLGRYHEVTGAPFYAIPGVAGIGALRARHSNPAPGRQPFWKAPLPVGTLRGAGPLVWSRPLPADAAGNVHVFDVNGQYLAALKNARVAWGRLQPTGATGFDPAAAGYWLLSLDHIPAEVYDGSRPPVFPAPRGVVLGTGTPGGEHVRQVWVTSPVAEYLAGRGVAFDVLDSYTCDNRSPVFRQYAERLIDARSGAAGSFGQLDKHTLNAIKATYTQLVGLLGREGGRAHRPDWQHTIMDLARMNLLRRLDKAADQLGAVPFAVRTDAAYFLTPDTAPDELAAVLGVGTAPGTFKFVETITVEQARAKFETGARV